MNSNPLWNEGRDEVQRIRSKLQSVSQAFAQLRDGLSQLGIQPERLEPGEVELSVLFPRELFDNRFDTLLKEGGLVDRLVSTASEIATGKVEPASVKEISTTDPVFVLVASSATILLVGRAVNVVLDAYMKVQKIRIAKAAAESAEAGASVIKALSKQAEDRIHAEIKEFTQGLAKEPTTKLKGPTLNGVLAKLEHTMVKLAARIDRGLRIEVAAQPDGSDIQDGEDQGAAEMLREIQKISGASKYFQIEGSPILGLPAPGEDDDPLEEKASKASPKE